MKKTTNVNIKDDYSIPENKKAASKSLLAALKF